MKNIEYKDYGKINLKLDKMMKEKNISTYALAKATNVEFKTIQNLRETSITRVDLNVLAKICYALEISDMNSLIEYN